MADEVAKRIYAQRTNFYRTKNIMPNVVMLGYETFYELQNESEYVRHTNPTAEEPQIFGMKIERIDRHEYLAVGFIEKEVRPDETLSSSE